MSCSATRGGSQRATLSVWNAASAASFASCLIRITVLTSTPHSRAASACESSCEHTSRNTSHFSSGVNCRRLRRLPFSITSSSCSGGEGRLRIFLVC